MKRQQDLKEEHERPPLPLAGEGLGERVVGRNSVPSIEPLSPALSLKGEGAKAARRMLGVGPNE